MTHIETNTFERSFRMCSNVNKCITHFFPFSKTILFNVKRINNPFFLKKNLTNNSHI